MLQAWNLSDRISKLLQRQILGLDLKQSYIYYTMGHMWSQIDIQSKKQSNWVF